MIQATAGGCRMLIAKSPAIGSDRDVLRRYAEAADQIFVVFRGRVYADQPDWLTVSDFLWARFRRELGLEARAAPVLAVIAGANCGADRLSWGARLTGRKVPWNYGSPCPPCRGASTLDRPKRRGRQ